MRVEAIFSATFKMDIAELPEGDIVEARFAMFFEGRSDRPPSQLRLLPPLVSTAA